MLFSRMHGVAFAWVQEEVMRWNRLIGNQALRFAMIHWFVGGEKKYSSLA